MKKIFIIILLFLTFETLVKADDIRDFQIEGISIGDSAIDFFTEERIKERKKVGFIYPSKDFYSATIYKGSKFKLYDHVQFHIKKNDNKYIIHSIGGQIDFSNDISNCYNEFFIYIKD